MDSAAIHLELTEDEGALHCPLCDYNLRGLSEPRCPECGHRFDWAELRSTQENRHPFLFEHHPTHRIWSFLRTLIAGLRPFKFWRTLRPAHYTRGGRIVAYWGLIVVLMALLFLASCVGMILQSGLLGYISAANPRMSSFDALLITLGFVAPIFPLICLLAWPWLTLATFAIFLVSLGRARIRFAHVMRCALYSGDAVFWIAPLLPIVPFVLPSIFPWPLNNDDLTIAAIATAGLLWMSARLIIAARIYLSFHQSVIMAALTQVIVLGPLWIYWAGQWVMYTTLN